MAQQVIGHQAVPLPGDILAPRQEDEQQDSREHAEQPLGPEEMERANHAARASVRTAAWCLRARCKAVTIAIRSSYATSNTTAAPMKYHDSSRVGRHDSVFWFAGVIASSVA